MNSHQLQTPVLLLTFNRPDTTVQVLEAIRAARPTRLFVASDGPRPNVPTDAERVAATRALVDEMVDWPCHIEYRYSDANQGCRIGVSSAISWFFEHVEEGIILEDDCVPHPDFFGYCTELLERYRDDDRVMLISGDNSVKVSPTQDVSYTFVRLAPIWGWATWRQAWARYDNALEAWPGVRGSQAALKQLWPHRQERRLRTRVLDAIVRNNGVDSWAFIWTFSVSLHDGLCVVPKANLVSNVGFGPAATHTTSLASPRARVSTDRIRPLRHPPAVERDLTAERRFFDALHRQSLQSRIRSLRSSIPRRRT